MEMTYIPPEIEIIDIADLENMSALAGSCDKHCGGR